MGRGQGTLASAQLAGGETLALFERGAACPSGLSNCANLEFSIVYTPDSGGTTTLHYNGNVIDTHAYETDQSGVTPDYVFGGAFNPTTGQVFDASYYTYGIIDASCFVRTAFQQTGDASEWTWAACTL